MKFTTRFRRETQRRCSSCGTRFCLRPLFCGFQVGRGVERGSDIFALTEFDRYVFESIAEKVIVGGIDNAGNKDPALLTFIYKTGFTNAVNGNNHKSERKNSKSKNNLGKLCSNTSNEIEGSCSDYSDPAC
jgi:hypothetical protein